MSWMPGSRRDAWLGSAAAGLFDHLQQRPQHVGHALPAHGGDHERRLLRRALESRHLLLDGGGTQRVGLAERDDLRLVRKALAIGGEFSAHRLVCLAGVPARAVDEMQKHAAALDVTEEAVAKADTFMRAL